MQIPTFIEELVEAGIPVTLQKGGSFYIEGFYKSSGITIERDTDNSLSTEWLACARYGEVDNVDCLRDIVALNYRWWQNSKDRYEGWSQPGSDWVPLLMQFEFIQEKTIPATVVYE